MKATIQEFNQKKEQVLDYLRFFAEEGASSYDILEGCDVWSYKYLRRINKTRFCGPIGALSMEGKIKYNHDTERWYIVE